MSRKPVVGGDSLGRASFFLASGTVVSRILGFISAVILARTLGIVGSGADTFALANQLPNNIYAIVAGGVLSAVLVPHIVRAGLDKDGGQSFVNKMVTLGFVVFLAVAVLATLLAPALVALYAQQSSGSGRGFSEAEIALAVAFAYWCLPQVLFYAFYSLLSEVLNARKVFGPFTWAPALNNLVAMTGLITFGIVFPSHDSANAVAWTSGMVALLAGSATLGVAAQAFILLAFWRRAGLAFKADFAWRGVGLAQTGQAALWVFGMILLAQIAGVVQANVASLAAGTNAPSIAVLHFSWLIFMLPHSVVAVSLATAYFTRMAAHARDQEFDLLRADFRESVGRIGFFMVLAQAGLVVVAQPFARQFGVASEATSAMSVVIVLFVLGLVPFSVLFVVKRMFYALGDTRTPFFIQLFHSLLFIALALYVSTFETHLIAYGLATAITISGVLQSFLGLVLLRRKLGSLGLWSLAKKFVTFLVAAAPAAATGVALLVVLGGMSPTGFLLSHAVNAALGITIITAGMTVVYGTVLFFMGSEDMKSVLAPVVARLGFRRGGNTSS